MATKPKAISIDLLILDGGTQSRAEIDEYTVDRYVEVLEAQTDTRWPFPPLVVFHDGSRYLVSSGFHRTLAARRHGRASIPCEVKHGTAWDALLFGMGANQKHGLPPSAADNRQSIRILLTSGKRMSHREIAGIVHVSTRTVRRVAAQLREEAAEEDDEELDDDTESSGGGEEEDEEEEAEDEPEQTPAERIATQRSKTVKTAEALMRAFDDLNELRPKRNLDKIITDVIDLISIAKNWK